MKKAVIVVGTHYAGKSKTIREHLKPKLGIAKNEHKFIRNGKAGFVLSQSLEEADRDVDYVIKKYVIYDLLVLSSRPAHERPSCLNELKAKLQTAGYRVSEVLVDRTDEEDYYDSKADEILNCLDH